MSWIGSEAKAHNCGGCLELRALASEKDNPVSNKITRANACILLRWTLNRTAIVAVNAIAAMAFDCAKNAASATEDQEELRVHCPMLTSRTPLTGFVWQMLSRDLTVRTGRIGSPPRVGREQGRPILSVEPAMLVPTQLSPAKENVRRPTSRCACHRASGSMRRPISSRIQTLPDRRSLQPS